MQQRRKNTRASRTKNKVQSKRRESSGPTKIIQAHIVKTPGVCGGKACIKGHRIRVMDIVVWHEMRNYSAEEIIAMFPGITLADVYAALTYYFDNRQEIQADFARSDALAKKLTKKHPSKASRKRSA